MLITLIGVIERAKDTYFAPTVPGEEPKLVSLMKTITWISVLLLVLVEIYVSFKVGGSPFGGDKSAPMPEPPRPTLTELMNQKDEL